MKYNAVGVGSFDLMGNYHKDNITSDKRLPFVSLNAQNSAGANPFKPYTIVKAGQYSIGITSIAGPTKGATKYTSGSWKKALSKQLPEMKKNVDFIILLSNLTTTENKRIAKDFPGINVIINADENINNLSASLIGRTLITQTEPLGKYIGILDIEIDQSKKWKPNYFKINSLKRKQISIPNKINSLKKGQSGTENTVTISELKKELADLPNKIKKAESELKTQKGSSFKVTFVPIEVDIDENSAISNILK